MLIPGNTTMDWVDKFAVFIELSRDQDREKRERQREREGGRLKTQPHKQEKNC